MEGKVLGQVRSVLRRFQERVDVSPETWSICPCSCLMAPVSLVGYGGIGGDSSAFKCSLMALPRSRAFPSAQLLGFRANAQFTAWDLSSVGHGSQEGQGLFLGFPLGAEGSSSGLPLPAPGGLQPGVPLAPRL